MVLYGCISALPQFSWQSSRPHYEMKNTCVSGKPTKRCGKNILLTILASVIPGLQEMIRFSSSNSCFRLDFGVFCIVPSGWGNDKGTGVRGYHNTFLIFTLSGKAWNKMLPKRSIVIAVEVPCRPWNFKYTSLGRKFFNLLSFDWSRKSA